MNDATSDNPDRDATFEKWGIPVENYRRAPAAPPPAADTKPAAAPVLSGDDIARAIAPTIAVSNQQLLQGLAHAMTPPQAPPPAPEVRVDDIEPPPEIVEQGALAVSRYVAAEASKRTLALSAQHADRSAQGSAAQAIQALQGAQLAAQVAPTWAKLSDPVKQGVHMTLAQNPQYAQADFATKLSIAENYTRQMFGAAPQPSGTASTVEGNIGTGGGSRPTSVPGGQKGDSQEQMARDLMGSLRIRS